MRDDRGHYLNTKAITALGPDWAHGCAKCTYGLVDAPDILGMFPLAEGRAGQAAEDLLTFCDCRAGFLYRQYLRKVWAALSLTARANLREHVCAARVPSIHLEVTP